MDQDLDEEDDMNKLFSNMDKSDAEDNLDTDNEVDDDDDEDAKSVDSMSDLFPGIIS